MFYINFLIPQKFFVSFKTVNYIRKYIYAASLLKAVAVLSFINQHTYNNSGAIEVSTGCILVLSVINNRLLLNCNGNN